jgi:hypothetical protein
MRRIVNLNQRFGACKDNLKIDPDQLERARGFHREMSDHLTAAGVATRTRLQGSLARSTMEPPLHDIDKVIELNPALADELAGPDGPETAMVLIRDTVAPHLPGAFFEIKKHALGITIADEEFDFDAVPAFATPGNDKWILIADTKGHEWKPSNTYDLIDTVAARNQVCEGRFVHQVRMARRIVSHAQVDLPGLHIESFCYEAITATISYPEGIVAALATGANLLGTHYYEPTGVDRISDRLDPCIKQTAQQALGRLAAQAAEAVRMAIEGDEDGAAHIWADLFGDDCFPRPSADEKRFLSQLWAGATTAPAAPAVARPTPTTRAWRPE